MRLISTMVFWGLFVLALPNSGNSEEMLSKKALDKFISKALENNPGLKVLQNQIKVAREIPFQVGSLDDPILNFEFKSLPVDTFSFGQETMTQKQISVSQLFPFPGKLKLKTEIAEKGVAISERDLDLFKLKVVRDVKTSFFELSSLLTSIEITHENKTLLQQFLSIAETRYSIGKGIQQDVLKAQVELSKIMDQLIELEQFRDVEKAKLNILMNQLPQKPLTIPQGIIKSNFSFTIDELQKIAEERHPLLKKIRSLKKQFEISKQLAEKEYYPNFNIGIKYGQRESAPTRNRPDLVSASIGINIPLWHKTKQSRKVNETRYQIDKIQEGYNDSRNLIFFKIKKSMDQQLQGSKTLKLIKQGIIPQAQQSLESALAGYNVDKVNFLTLLDNQVTLFKWKIKYHKELARHEKVLAQLEQAVGANLF